jgi:hypothetical protein
LNKEIKFRLREWILKRKKRIQDSDEDMSIPPIFPAMFYKRLAEGAQKLGISRTRLALRALLFYLKSVETKKAPMAKTLGDEELSEKYKEAQGKLSKKWWSTLTEEERRERALKAIRARWDKKKDEPEPEQ